MTPPPYLLLAERKGKPRKITEISHFTETTKHAKAKTKGQSGHRYRCTTPGKKISKKKKKSSFEHLFGGIKHLNLIFHSAIGLNGCVGLIRENNGMSKPKENFAGKFSAGHVLWLSWPLFAFAFSLSTSGFKK